MEKHLANKNYNYVAMDVQCSSINQSCDYLASKSLKIFIFATYIPH